MSLGALWAALRRAAQPKVCGKISIPKETPMNAPPALKPAALYDQLCDLPENLTGEIINGQLHSQPRPSGRHGLAGGTLNIDLGAATLACCMCM